MLIISLTLLPSLLRMDPVDPNYFLLTQFSFLGHGNDLLSNYYSDSAFA